MNIAPHARRRLEELRAEQQKGRQMLAGLDARREEIRDTLVRIGGAIQVLEELLKAEGALASDREAAA